LRDPEHPGTPGRPRLCPWRTVGIAQVVTRYGQRRVGEGEHRVVQGTLTRVEPLRRCASGDGGSHTVDIERLNATFRERLALLARRWRVLARQTLSLRHGIDLTGTVDNCCTPHERVCVAGNTRTPARAAGITDHCWTIQELLSFHMPPPRWTPSKPRGYPSHALQGLIERWGYPGSYPDSTLVLLRSRAG
jgi:hypothetical protein